MKNSESSPVRSCVNVDTLAGSVAILMLLQLLQRAIGFGRGIVFCRWLTPEELGQWEMAFSFLMLAGPAAVLSLHAALGRYLEYFRLRGQLHAFLCQVAAVTAMLAVLAALVIWLHLPWFSELIFGRADQHLLTTQLTICLLAVIGQNFMTDLFTALRMQRVASGLQVLHTILFAVLGILLLLGWQLSAGSLILAYGAASAASLLASAPWIFRTWRSKPVVLHAPVPVAIWTRVLPYAISVWLANWLNSLFSMVDRYMIMHHSGMSAAEALAQVGQYHSSRLAPLLFVTFAGLLSGILVPHLSHDWEMGRKHEVSVRLNAILRWFGLAVSLGGIVVLWVAPAAFDLLFLGKFSGGVAVLPATLTYCAWAGLAFVARTYLNCAESAWMTSVAYVVGLAVNIGLNAWWLPQFGLAGAVWATVVGNLAALFLIIFFSWWRGMRVGLNTCLVCALPACFGLGRWPASMILLAIGCLAISSDRLFTALERQEFMNWTVRRLDRIGLRWPGQKAETAIAN